MVEQAGLMGTLNLSDVVPDRSFSSGMNSLVARCFSVFIAPLGAMIGFKK
jgi:hypothetical protein